MESHCLTILVKFCCTRDWNWFFFSCHAFSTNLPNFFPFLLLLSSPNALRLAFFCKSVISESTWWQVFQQMWRGLSVAIFPLMMIFALLVQRKTLFQLCRLVRPLLLTSSLFPGFPDQTNLWSLYQQYFHPVLFTLICSSNVWSWCECNQLKSKVKTIQMNQFFLAGNPHGSLYQFRISF